MIKKGLVIAVTGASGSIYALRLMEKIAGSNVSNEQVFVVFSGNAKKIWNYELPGKDPSSFGFGLYEADDFNAPFASGSARPETMIVCPCSAGSLARIANGISDNLITRAADVMLKERRRLILVLRETPLSLIQITNMSQATLAGALICPACPSFYSHPQTMADLADTVVERVLDLAGLENGPAFRWQSGPLAQE